MPIEVSQEFPFTNTSGGGTQRRGAHDETAGAARRRIYRIPLFPPYDEGEGSAPEDSPGSARPHATRDVGVATPGAVSGRATAPSRSFTAAGPRAPSRVACERPRRTITQSAVSAASGPERIVMGCDTRTHSPHPLIGPPVAHGIDVINRSSPAGSRTLHPVVQRVPAMQEEHDRARAARLDGWRVDAGAR